MILLVIDMQKGLVDEDLYAFDIFLDRTVRLVDAARKNNVEVIFFQHDAGPESGMSVGDEAFEIIDQIAPKAGEKVFIKTINSCFGNKDFKQYMKQQEDKRLMIIGLQTNYCIDATVKSAFERGFQVIIPEGTNSTFDNDYMTGETTYRYYNEDVWEELVDAVTFEEAVARIEAPQRSLSIEVPQRSLSFFTLRENPALKDTAAEWFHNKWGVPKEAYLECMESYLDNETEFGWYLCMDGSKIVGGLGVIENDFHDRKDLRPNICAVYTDEEYRCKGIAGHLLDMAVDDLKAKGITPVYLVTDHIGFYEKYGWQFFCMVQGDGEPDMTRMYIHR